jgi:putative transposase
MVDFKGSQFPKDVILYAVWFYVRFPASYRDLEEIMVEFDHATLNRWVERYSEQVASEALKQKAQPARSWRIDET